MISGAARQLAGWHHVNLQMDNQFIADQLTLFSNLLHIHGGNSYLATSCSIAAYAIEKLPANVEDIPVARLTSVKGIGESTAKRITELIQTGEIKELNHLIKKTPPGVFEMLNIKGVGPKKIASIWREMKIDSIDKLLIACKENRLAGFKGFGAKTQQNIQEGIEVYLRKNSAFLYAQVEWYAIAMNEKLKKAFKKFLIEQTGDFRRHLLVIDKLEWVTTAPVHQLEKYFTKNDFETKEANLQKAVFKSHTQNLLLHFYITGKNNFYHKLFETSCSEQFLLAWKKDHPFETNYASEKAIFKQSGAAYIEPYLREQEYIIPLAEKNRLPGVIEVKDIRGIIHCHSSWSDGTEKIETLAKAAIENGFEYLVLTDHSKTAHYAKGLSEEKIVQQHQEIDKLNKKLKPFKIFKSIESDILSDGSLDYAPAILSTFDLIIASPHGGLKAEGDKATNRIIRAIENPHTSIMGHITGRLLLSRRGMLPDMKKIIDACAANNVVIELNANPRRLDIDWKYLPYCLQKNVLTSINPDAHSIAEFDLLKYGVYAAQKGGVTKKNNLSSFSLKQFEAFVQQQKKKRNT